jgi:hypothetical protein
MQAPRFFRGRGAFLFAKNNLKNTPDRQRIRAIVRLPTNEGLNDGTERIGN